MHNFKYLQPKTLKDATQTLSRLKGNSLLYAGGTDVLGLVKNNIFNPDNLINLKSIKGLNEIKYFPGKEIHIGALTKLSEIVDYPAVKEKFYLLYRAISEIASPQFRNVATIGGNLCQRPRCFYFRGDFNCLRKGGDICYAVDGQNKYHCIVGGGPCYIVHPSDSAVALTALNAKLSIFSQGKLKNIPIRDFFILPEKNHTKENILNPGDVLEKIIIPEPELGTKSDYIKFKERETWDFAVVSVAAVIKQTGGITDFGRVAFGGVAPVPYQVEELNKKLKGITHNEKEIIAFTNLFFKDAVPLEKNKYKIPLARNLLKRILLNLTS